MASGISAVAVIVGWWRHLVHIGSKHTVPERAVIVNDWFGLLDSLDTVLKISLAVPVPSLPCESFNADRDAARDV